MCLVRFARAYITHVCKDCITASQGSLWINQNVASQGLWTHVSIESPLIWQARSRSRRGGTAATGDVVQQTCPWLRCSCYKVPWPTFGLPLTFTLQAAVGILWIMELRYITNCISECFNRLKDALVNSETLRFGRALKIKWYLSSLSSNATGRYRLKN